MSNKVIQQTLLMAAMMGAMASSVFETGRGRRVEDKKESPEDKERRERCAKMAIEKAKAKRERKEKKRRLNARKEE